MKRLLFSIIFLTVGNIYAQRSSEILPVLNTDAGITPPNFVFVQPGTNYWGKTDVTHLTLPISQITSLQSSLDSKFIIPTGNSLEYLNGLGVPTLFPTIVPVNLTGGNRIVITGTYPNLTISFIEPTINIITTKTLNSNYTVSATKQATVSYSLTCSVTNPLLAGSSTANAYLEYSINTGSTWLLPSQNGNSSSVGLAVAIAITNGQTVTVTGVIPANALVRLRTVTTGTASVVYVTGTEIY